MGIIFSAPLWKEQMFVHNDENSMYSIYSHGYISIPFCYSLYKPCVHTQLYKPCKNFKRSHSVLYVLSPGREKLLSNTCLQTFTHTDLWLLNASVSFFHYSFHSLAKKQPWSDPFTALKTFFEVNFIFPQHGFPPLS